MTKQTCNNANIYYSTVISKTYNQKTCKQNNYCFTSMYKKQCPMQYLNSLVLLYLAGINI